jgi:hypothetical protein
MIDITYILLYRECYFQVKANDTLMQLVGVDWLSSDAREDDLSSRPGSIVQVFPFSFHLLLELDKILIIIKILLLKLLTKCALNLYLFSNMQQKVVQNSSLLSTCK